MTIIHNLSLLSTALFVSKENVNLYTGSP